MFRFTERTVIWLREAGITDIILPAGYLPEAITSHFGDGSRFDVRMRYVIEETPLGTAGALKNVAHLIHGAFFVLKGDVLTSLDLRDAGGPRGDARRRNAPQNEWMLQRGGTSSTSSIIGV